MARIVTLVTAALAAAIAARAAGGAVRAVSIADLARASDAVVISRTLAVAGRWNPAHTRIETVIELDIEETLAGGIAPGRATIVELGGRVGDVASVVAGAPRFEPGQRALLFLARSPDGSLHVTHRWQGLFGLERDPAGVAVAVRRDPDTGAIVDALALDDARALVSAAAGVPGTPGERR